MKWAFSLVVKVATLDIGEPILSAQSDGWVSPALWKTWVVFLLLALAQPNHSNHFRQTGVLLYLCFFGPPELRLASSCTLASAQHLVDSLGGAAVLRPVLPVYLMNYEVLDIL